ncbi:MAG: AEC family transporter [Verrucomicrobiia bacterium]
MIPISIVVQAVAPIFILALGGLFIRRYNILSAEADSSLLKLTINVFSPCLAFDSIVGNRALHIPSNLLIAPIIGYSTVAIGVLLALITSRALKLNNKVKGTFALTVGLYNYGYVPLPLALYLFNRETAGVLFVHNIGVEVALWTIGVLLLSDKSGKKIDIAKIINIPLISILLSVVLNFLNAEQWIPKYASTAITMLGHCAIPMGVILIGATIYDYLDEFNPQKATNIILSSFLLRLLILPIIFLAIAYVLPCSKELKAVITLQAAMPSAVFPIVMTKHYGGDIKTALRVVISTSIVGLFTIPFWIQTGVKLLGLKH